MSINPKLDSSDYTILKRRLDSLFQVPIKSSAFDSWKCLNPYIPRDEAKDCTIQTFHFLDIIKDRKLAEQIAKYVHDKNGTHSIEHEQIPLYIFKYAEDIYNVERVDYMSWATKPFFTWYKILKKNLKKGYGTIINGHRGGNGHSFVVGKDKNDILYVWDPQQSIFKTGYDGLHDYMKKGEYITMYYITKKADKPRRSSKSNRSSSSHRITKKHKKDKETKIRIQQEKKKRNITIKKNKEAREKRKQGREKRIQMYAMKTKKKQVLEKENQMDISSSKSSSSHRMDISSPSSISSKKSKKKRKNSTSLLNNTTKKQRSKRQALIDRFRYRVSDSESL